MTLEALRATPEHLSPIRQVAEILKAVCFWDDIGSLQKCDTVDP